MVWVWNYIENWLQPWTTTMSTWSILLLIIGKNVMDGYWLWSGFTKHCTTQNNTRFIREILARSKLCRYLTFCFLKVTKASKEMRKEKHDSPLANCEKTQEGNTRLCSECMQLGKRTVNLNKNYCWAEEGALLGTPNPKKQHLWRRQWLRSRRKTCPKPWQWSLM